MLDLAAVDDRLREHAVFIAHAVAPRREFERCHRIEEAGGEPAEAAVAERGVGFALDELGERRSAGGCEGGFGGVSEIQRGERVIERAADQEFHRQVVDSANLASAVGDLRLDPALGEFFADEQRECGIEFLGVRRDRFGRDRMKQFFVDRLSQCAA